MNHLTEMPPVKLNTIEEALEDLRAGKLIIVVDDEKRENEGDFICAAEHVTPEIINFMSLHGRGLICMPLEETRANELGFSRMVSQNTALHETAFTVSIDYKHKGCTTGISAYDRATCIQAVLDPKSKSEDFARPGHVFPLIAKPGGVLRRTGHTEAAVDLARLAGLYPAGVLVEVLKENGEMARLPELLQVAQKHRLKIISIADLVAYRMKKECLIKEEVRTAVDTPFGKFTLALFSQQFTNDIHFALIRGNWTEDEVVKVRVESSPFGLNPVLSLLNGLIPRMEKSLQRMAEEGKGVYLYMQHSEQEIDVLACARQHRKGKKPFSCKEQQKNNYEHDQRDFGAGAQILRSLGIRKMHLLTTDPSRRRIGLEGYGLEIVKMEKI